MLHTKKNPTSCAVVSIKVMPEMLSKSIDINITQALLTVDLYSHPLSKKWHKTQAINLTLGYGQRILETTT